MVSAVDSKVLPCESMYRSNSCPWPASGHTSRLDNLVSHIFAILGLRHCQRRHLLLQLVGKHLVDACNGL
jgi:hypothetical protein